MKPSIAAQIYALLLKNTKGENAFMTYADMGSAIFGQGFNVRKHQGELIKMIKTQMFQVSEIAIANGHSIVPSRKETKAKNRTFMITGWKIPMEADAEYVVKELFYKQTNGRAKEASYNKFKEINLANRVISNNHIKQLELNQ